MCLSLGLLLLASDLPSEARLEPGDFHGEARIMAGLSCLGGSQASVLFFSRFFPLEVSTTPLKGKLAGGSLLGTFCALPMVWAAGGSNFVRCGCGLALLANTASFRFAVHLIGGHTFVAQPSTGSCKVLYKSELLQCGCV